MEKGRHNWHRLTAEEALRQLGSSANGLSGKEASSRLKRNGYNRMFDLPRRKNTLARRLLTDPALLLFLFMMVLSACFAEILSVLPSLVLFVLWITCVAMQAIRVDRAQERLNRCGIPTVTVFRNHKPLIVSARNIVVGDVIRLGKGDIVPADCRLISSAELRVVFPWENDKANHRTVSCKKADTVYPYQSECHAPHFENLVYAGSEIVGGSAIAVVFAVGRETFLGMLDQPVRRDGFEKEFQQVGQFIPYFKLWSFFALILLFPVGIAGLLISPDSQSGMRVFLPICAWMATASAILPYCYLQIAVHHRIRRLFMKKSDGNGALIKTSKAVDRLPFVTDLVLLGRGAISDGKRHFVSAFVGGGCISAEDEQSGILMPLCEAFCLLEDARSRLPYHFSVPSDQAEPYLDELVKKSGFDRETLTARILKTELFRGRQEQILDVESADGQFRLRFYHGGASLFGCGYYLRENGALAALSHEKREAYESFVLRATATGQRTVTVVREQRGTVTLIGCVSLGELFLPDLSQAVSQLEQKGIRVRLFLRDESEESLARAVACMPRRTIRRRSQIEDLNTVSDEERLFVGYSVQQITDRVRAWRKKGRVVAVASCNADDRAAMSAASVSIGCDLFSTENDARCNPILQRDADLLVAGASARGGGLLAVREAIFGLRQTADSINRFFGRLFVLRILQTVTMLLSVALGMGYIPAYAVLYSSLFMDAFLLIQVLRDEKSSRQGKAPHQPFAIFKQRSVWLCALIPPVALTVILRIFYGMEWIATEHCYLTLFLSMMLMETLMLTIGEQRIKLSFKAARDLLILWLPVIGVSVLSVFVPKIVQVSELDAGNVISWVVLAFCVGLETILLLLHPKMRD